MAEEESSSLEYTPTWVVGTVCFVIVLISLIAERGLHHIGKFLKHKHQDALFEALQKLKEELMLLGFISLLLTVFQGLISKMCIEANLAYHMLPCKRHTENKTHEKYSAQVIKSARRQLFSTGSSSGSCPEGKAPFMSLEALHHLHIFIFVLAIVHMIFCATTMVLGGARIREWKKWEDSVRNESTAEKGTPKQIRHQNFAFVTQHAGGYWRNAAVISWMISFFKQFYGSVTKSDYIALRQGFIMTHCPRNPKFDFHKYMMRTLEVDFKKIVSISWYLWLFVVIFLLLNVEGWHTFFWLSFLPLVLLLLVGAKLEHIIARLAQEVVEKKKQDQEALRVKPSDEHFWFHRPGIILDLIHFILFQNAFELAFFFWILSTYGFHSCIIERLGYIIPRLIMGVIVQVLCSYSTLPLYALVTQMGSKFKQGIFDNFVHDSLTDWLGTSKSRGETSKGKASTATATQMNKMAKESYQTKEEEMIVEEMIRSTTIELSSAAQTHESSP